MIKQKFDLLNKISYNMFNLTTDISIKKALFSQVDKISKMWITRYDIVKKILYTIQNTLVVI